MPKSLYFWIAHQERQLFPHRLHRLHPPSHCCGPVMHVLTQTRQPMDCFSCSATSTLVVVNWCCCCSCCCSCCHCRRCFQGCLLLAFYHVVVVYYCAHCSHCSHCCLHPRHALPPLFSQIVRSPFWFDCVRREVVRSVVVEDPGIVLRAMFVAWAGAQSEEEACRHCRYCCWCCFFVGLLWWGVVVRRVVCISV